MTVIATGFDGARDLGCRVAAALRPARAPREPARTPARPAATPDAARPPALDAEERKEFEISDDALEIPDFLKER